MVAAGLVAGARRNALQRSDGWAGSGPKGLIFKGAVEFLEPYRQVVTVTVTVAAGGLEGCRVHVAVSLMPSRASGYIQTVLAL